MRHIKFILISVVAAAVLAAVALSFFPSGTGSSVRRQENAEGALCSSDSSANFLLLGIDEASASSDVIMLARIDKSGKITVLQVPRDTYTSENGRINSIFARAYADAVSGGEDKNKALEKGAQAMADFFSSSLGIKTDAYAVLTLDALGEIVDSAGGVDVTLDRSLDYDDPVQNLHIHLEKGTVHLDGEKAQGLVRMRSAYLSADYGRMDAQKLFMAAFLRKVKSSLSLVESLSLMKTAYESTVSSISLSQALHLGRILLSADSQDILLASVKGEAFKVERGGAVMICELLQRENLDAVAGIFAPDGTADYSAFCPDDEEARELFEGTPLYPLEFTSISEIDENGIEIR